MDDRVIMIKGDSTKWYDRAIFIVKQNTPQKSIPVDLVAEAEKIIYQYIYRSTGHTAPSFGTAASAPAAGKKRAAKSGGNFDLWVNLIMLTSCIILAGLLMWKFS